MSAAVFVTTTTTTEKKINKIAVRSRGVEFYMFPIIVSGPNTKTTIAILNCLVARQLCFEDAACSAILEIIPRVCGPELGKSLLHIFKVILSASQTA